MRANNTNRPGQTAAAGMTWSAYKYPDSLINFLILLLILVFLGFSIDFLNIKLSRFFTMFGRLWTLFSTRVYPLDVAYIGKADYLRSVVETLQMAILGTLFGTIIAVPLAWLGSFNLTPNKKILYPLGRFGVMGSRAVHEMIWTIIFVVIFGYGMLPGVLALTMRTIGFSGKLFSEEMESIKWGQVEAIQASGANRIQVLLFGVFPQVKVAWTGITVYAWDSAFRASTVVGFFGAGGMGMYLRRTVDQMQYPRVGAILGSIIIVVIISEVASAWARNRLYSK